MPNYGQNPTTPQPGDPNNQQGSMGVMPYQRASQPKGIREYFQAAQAMGQAPLYTNVPSRIQSGEGMQVGAIPQETTDPYERKPASERRMMDPYQRAKERLPSLLPELWAQLFPGRPEGATLTEQEIARWHQGVAKLTNTLVQDYDEEYGTSVKVRMKNKDKLLAFRESLRDRYDRAELQGAPPINPETQQPMTFQEWAAPRMEDYEAYLASLYETPSGQSGLPSAAQGQQGAIPEQAPIPEGQTPRTTRPMIQQAFAKDPALQRNVMNEARAAYNRVAGTKLSPEEFVQVGKSGDPQRMKLWNESVRDAINYYEDEILKRQ